MERFFSPLLTLFFISLSVYWPADARTGFGITAARAAEASYYVATGGSDANPGTESLPWKTIQKACNSATPGSTVYIRAGTYHEKMQVNVSGTASGGFITFRNYGAESVVLDGDGAAGPATDDMIYLENASYVKIQGLEIRNNLGVSDASGIRVVGYGDHIEILGNRIHDIRGDSAMGITVYGTDPVRPVSDLVIDGNEIYDCEPAHSEALTLNGNVEHFRIVNNVVHDVNNIGVDMIGGEGLVPDPAKDAARKGVCSGNVVYNARSSYGDGMAAGIYVDGGNTIVVERNTVYACDTGIEVGCERPGTVAYDVIVRDNLVYRNDKRGIGFGGYNYPLTGTVRDCLFLNNTCFNNDTFHTGAGELAVEHADGCEVRNNIFYSSPGGRLMLVSRRNRRTTLTLDYNLWFIPPSAPAATVEWMGNVLSYEEYGETTGQDAHSIFADPVFVSMPACSVPLHLGPGSPAVDRGDPSFEPAAGETDVDGQDRVSGGRVDIGADEYGDNATTAASPAGNQPPVVTLLAAEPGKGAAPLAVTFTCSACDPDGAIVSYAWDFDGDGTADDTGAAGTASFTFESDGVYPVTVTVTDDAGSSLKTAVTVEVGDQGGGGCPLRSVLGADAASLQSFRGFRDSVLSGTPEGRRLIRLYYRHADEITVLLRADPALRRRAALCVSAFLPLARRAAGGSTIVLHAGMVQGATALIDELALRAGGGLRRELEGLKQSAGRSTLPGALGIDVVP